MDSESREFARLVEGLTFWVLSIADKRSLVLSMTLNNGLKDRGVTGTSASAK